MVHAFPTEEQFTEKARHESTFVLDGGLPKWLAEQREAVSSMAKPNELGDIRGVLQPDSVCDSSYLLKELDAEGVTFSRLVPHENQQTVFSCGSGITACIILMAAVIAGHQKNVLYDGSWADWGSNPSLPVATLD
ncbi:sulfurtransferase [Marinobacter sp. AC-23]|uniref:sulfurtransferase n=1 Tax=Marinobacter sp. AC-23 TaxID=1879031 RepID=UPI0008DE54E5|nr:hypothetical protein [Marinobacter sp. AC-23]OHY80965.1 hypothetical protein BCA33_02885 [Marinobacter sp. AC-23]